MDDYMLSGEINHKHVMVRRVGKHVEVFVDGSCFNRYHHAHALRAEIPIGDETYLFPDIVSRLTARSQPAVTLRPQESEENDE